MDCVIHDHTRRGSRTGRGPICTNRQDQDHEGDKARPSARRPARERRRQEVPQGRQARSRLATPTLWLHPPSRPGPHHGARPDGWQRDVPPRRSSVPVCKGTRKSGSPEGTSATSPLMDVSRAAKAAAVALGSVQIVRSAASRLVDASVQRFVIPSPTIGQVATPGGGGGIRSVPSSSAFAMAMTLSTRLAVSNAIGPAMTEKTPKVRTAAARPRRPPKSLHKPHVKRD